MRKDGKSQYTIKKEKLLEIKKIIQAEPDKDLIPQIMTYGKLEEHYGRKLKKIWEIVKDEK